MSNKIKGTSRSNIKNKKHTVNNKRSSDGEKSVWVFDRIDRGGSFAFDINDINFNHKLFLEKMIAYTNMTWSEIKTQTHDNNKSKHHFLSLDSLSKYAQERIHFLKLENETDCIFSFALTGKLRIIGLRENEKFHVVWYDPNHSFCPSKLKHT